MAELWSYTVGQKPHRVRAYERPGRANVYLRRWDAHAGSGGGWRKRSLGFPVREWSRDEAGNLVPGNLLDDNVRRAKSKAADLHKRLLEGSEALRGGNVTVARLFALYRREKTPTKGEQAQGTDDRHMEFWTRELGAETPVRSISPAAWNRALDRRQSGAVDARGNPVPEGARRPRGNRVGEQVARWLKSVCRWAVGREIGGVTLLYTNPVGNPEDYEVPVESSPTRIAATERRYRATLAVADDVDPHLSLMLALANECGRRVGAIRHLRHSDLLLDRGEHGMIRWRARHDKIKSDGDNDDVVVISPQAREALDAHLERFPANGDPWLFPHPSKEGEPISRWYPTKWLQAAEERAGLEPLDGKLWHAYRAKFATDLLESGVSVATIKKLGGWKQAETVIDIYGQPGAAQQQRALQRRHGADPMERAADLLDVDPDALARALAGLTTAKMEAA